MTQPSIDELTNLYWRKRREPGGTIEDPDGRIHHSEECQRIWDQVGDLLASQRDETKKTLLFEGVPEWAATLAGADLPIISEDSASWAGAWPSDGVGLLDRYLEKQGCELIHEWTDGHRWVWTDRQHALITCVEGDLSVEWAHSTAAFDRIYQAATAFYEENS